MQDKITRYEYDSHLYVNFPWRNEYICKYLIAYSGRKLCESVQ